MKPTLHLIFVLAACVALRAADDPRAAAVRASDDQRAAATVAADGAKLGALLSDELRYTHSSGLVDTKASYLQSIVSGRTKYHIITFEERNITFPASGIALEAGRAHMKATSPAGESDSIFSFLAVWREEKGQWRLLAWQSCKLPPATPNASAK